MGARTRKAAVELVEASAPAPVPLGPAASRGRVWSGPARWSAVVVVLALVAVVLAVVDGRGEAQRAAARDRLVAAGTFLAHVGPEARARWSVDARAVEILAVTTDTVVTVTELRGSQLVVGRTLDSGVERWRSTFALGLGTSRCVGPEHAEDAPLVVCALRARPRALGADVGGTAFHVRDAGTGELLAERSVPGALLGMRLADGDVLGAWLGSGGLEVRREDAVTGQERWRLPLETWEPVTSTAGVSVSVAGGEVVVTTERDVFALTHDGTVAFATTTAPPPQLRMLAVRPVGEGLYAVWRTRVREPADLIDADGGVLLAAIGTPRELVADDGSLGTVLLARHPDGDLLWDVVRRERLWRARGGVDVVAGLVVGGVFAVDTGAGVRAVDPRRGVELWRAPELTGLVGVADELVAVESGDLVGLEPRTGREVWRVAAGLDSAARFAVVGGHLFAVEPRTLTLLGN